MPEIEKNMLWLIFSKCLKVRRAREMEGEGFTSVCNPISSWFQAVWSSVKRNTLWSCGPNELWAERGEESRILLLTSSPLFIDCLSDELKKRNISPGSAKFLWTKFYDTCAYKLHYLLQLVFLTNCRYVLVCNLCLLTRFCDYLNFKFLNMHVNCIKNWAW